MKTILPLYLVYQLENVVMPYQNLAAFPSPPANARHQAPVVESARHAQLSKQLSNKKLVNPDIGHTLKRLEMAGHVPALISFKSQAFVETALTNAGLAHYFNARVFFADYSRRATYYTAWQAIRADMSTSQMEDKQFLLIAGDADLVYHARSFGLPAIGCLPPHTMDENEERFACDAFIDADASAVLRTHKEISAYIEHRAAFLRRHHDKPPSP